MFFGRGARPAETTPPLPLVDFEAVAGHAIDEGVFALGAITRAQHYNPHTRMPVTMLDTPYGNGPLEIGRNGRDVPIPAMNAVRKNFNTANGLLLPSEQVNLYFHHRFMRGDALDSKTLANAVASFHAADTERGSNETATSFQVRGKERKVYNRQLYTKEERIASLDFTIEHPEAALSILAYRSLVTDYLSELRAVFTGPAHSIPIDDVENYDDFIQQWNSENFEDELIPALTILHRDAQIRAPQTDGKDLIDQTLFQQALKFVTSNGGFRHWVTVPAHVAQNKVERVNEFLCPAVSATQEQLGDGEVLAKIYTIVSQKAGNNDPHVMGMFDTIRAAAEYQKHKPPEEERIANYLRRVEQGKHMEIVLDGQPTALRLDWEDFDRMTGRYNEGDTILTYGLKDQLDDVFKQAIIAVSQTGTPVYFQFIGEDYRVTPNDLQPLAAAARRIEQSD